MKRTGPSRRARRAAGFTLIELLVAVAILAVVAVLAWRGLDAVARGRDRLTQAMESERAMVQFFNQVRADTRRVANEEVVGTPPLMIGPARFRIVRRLEVPGQATHLQVIRYQIANGRIVRFASPPLTTAGALREALAASLADEEPDWSSVSLIGDVVALQARVFVAQQGWTSNPADLQRALERRLATPVLPQAAEAPPVRSVDGLEVRLKQAGGALPYIHSYLLGE